MSLSYPILYNRLPFSNSSMQIQIQTVISSLNSSFNGSVKVSKISDMLIITRNMNMTWKLSVLLFIVNVSW